MNTTPLEDRKKGFETEKLGFQDSIRLSRGLVGFCRSEYSRIQDAHAQERRQQEEDLQQIRQVVASLTDKLQMKAEMPPAAVPVDAEEARDPDELIQSFAYLEEMLGRLEHHFFQVEAIFLQVYEELRFRPDAASQAALCEKLELVLAHFAGGTEKTAAPPDAPLTPGPMTQTTPETPRMPAAPAADLISPLEQGTIEKAPEHAPFGDRGRIGSDGR